MRHIILALNTVYLLLSIPSQVPILALYWSITTGLGVRPPLYEYLCSSPFFMAESIGHSFLGLFSVFFWHLQTQYCSRFSSKILDRLPTVRKNLPPLLDHTHVYISLGCGSKNASKTLQSWIRQCDLLPETLEGGGGCVI
jgi:hypothetical protein